MIAKFKTWLARHKAYKQTIKELNSLTYHELRDLGLAPEMIPAIASEAAYGARRLWVLYCLKTCSRIYWVLAVKSNTLKSILQTVSV